MDGIGGVAPWLLVSGLVLFVAGDVLWLVRNTFHRPMDLRVTGALVTIGVLLMGAGLVSIVVTN